MKGLDESNNLILYVISNVIALFVLLAALKQIRFARLLFLLVFTWASWTNWRTAVGNPGTYLGEADLTFLPFYKQFILGWFSRHITLAVGFIATCQGLIAVSMLLRGWVFKLGGIGAIVFLLAIAPFGVGAAFPCTVILAVAMYLVLRSPHQNYLWIPNPLQYLSLAD